VACSLIERDDAGYATPLALAMCVAISVSITALMSAATSDLQLARRDLDRQRVEYALAGEQAVAAMTVAQSRGGSRLQWIRSGDGSEVEIVAEAQAQKLGYDAAADLPATVVQALRIQSPDALRTRLRTLDDQAVADGVPETLDDSQLWRLCAPALISRYGAAEKLVVTKPVLPAAGVSAAASKVGELWRIRVSGEGWIDERTVRFTGDPRRPAAVVERRFFRGEKVGSRCDAVFDAVARAG